LYLSTIAETSKTAPGTLILSERLPMMPNQDFTDEQKQYLQGFISGADIARATRGLPTFAQAIGGSAPPPGLSVPAPAVVERTGPDAPGLMAQDRAIAAGKKLTPQEMAKRKLHPLDMWDDIVTHSQEGRFPKGTDLLAFKYHGIFHVAPAQDSYMSRLRFAGGIVPTYQFRGSADLADRFGGGYLDITTRANLQIREIPASAGADYITAVHELGIDNHGSGADNIRNVTGSPTAGIDPQELIDTRPLASAMHHYIINHREMYGLPRKFNIAFDGGGAVAAIEDTNDIGFTAWKVPTGKAIPEGVYYRLQLGGITGHKDFARDTGVILRPDECVRVAGAIVRAYVDEGDRTDRNKARLKYVLDRLGFEAFLALVEKHYGKPLTRLPMGDCEPRPAVRKHGHVGVHPQKQPGLFYIGILTPVGRMTSDQARALADLADEYGSGVIRLTVWQSLILSDIPESGLSEVLAAIDDMGLLWNGSSVRAGLIACTGNAGCKFSPSNTKRHAMEIADHIDAVMTVDLPVNIHVTGCHHSCAQHYIGDIGLIGAAIAIGDDTVEGYHIFAGGGYGEEQGIAREIFRNVPASQCPEKIESLLRAWMASRQSDDETFIEFVKRYPTAELVAMAEGVGQLAGV